MIFPFFVNLNFPYASPTKPVTDRSETSETIPAKENETIFSDQTGQTEKNRFYHVFAFPNNLNERNLPNWFCQNGTANFGRTGLRGQSGPSQEWSLIFGQMELKRTFPFDTDRDSPKFWHNRRTPDLYIITQVVI